MGVAPAVVGGLGDGTQGQLQALQQALGPREVTGGQQLLGLADAAADLRHQLLLGQLALLGSGLLHGDAGEMEGDGVGLERLPGLDLGPDGVILVGRTLPIGHGGPMGVDPGQGHPEDEGQQLGEVQGTDDLGEAMGAPGDQVHHVPGVDDDDGLGGEMDLHELLLQVQEGGGTVHVSPSTVRRPPGGGVVGVGRSYQGLSMPGFFGCQIKALAMRRMLSSSSLICLRSSPRLPAHCSLVLRLLMTT